MLVRATVGFALLAGFLALGMAVARQRSVGRPPWRRLAGTVHRTVGVVAIAFLLVLALGIVRLVL